MRNDVLGDETQPFPGPDEGFQLRPFRLELLLTLDLFTLGRLLELRVDLGPFALVQGEPG